MARIAADELKAFTASLLEAGGFTADDAAATADLLVWANVRGIESHGVLRVPRYVEMLSEGIMVSGAPMTLVHETPAVAVIDCGQAPGAVGMNAAVGHALRLAAKAGVGWCAARAISHAGAVGYFTSAVARQGMIGIAMTASKPLMTYFGARGEALSTNPLSIAIPVADSDPILLDMSTAAVALGKVMAARDAGRPIPSDWAVDETGAATTDPAKVKALLPMAGAKGSGLSLMIEMLASVLPGNPVIAPILAGDRTEGFNGLIIAVDPAAFGAVAAFGEGVGALADAVHGLEPAAGIAKVLLPGERSAATRAEREATGIPLTAGTAQRLVELGTRLGVSVPATLAQA